MKDHDFYKEWLIDNPNAVAMWLEGHGFISRRLIEKLVEKSRGNRP